MSRPAFVAPHADGVTIRLKVTPRARHDSIGGEIAGPDGSALKVAVTAAADNGKANAAVAELLARSWRVAKSSVSLRQGATARNKLMHLAGDPAELQRRIDEWWQAHARQYAE